MRNRHPGLRLRGTIYYIRTRVPIDLIETIGQEEIWRSLDTGNHREAVRRYHLARSDLDQWFEAHRRRRAGIAPGEVHRLATAWFRSTDQHHAARDFALVGEDLSDAIGELGQDLFELRSGDGGEDVRAALDGLLGAAGWPTRATWPGPSRRAAAWPLWTPRTPLP